MWPHMIQRNEVVISVASGYRGLSEEVPSIEHLEGQRTPCGVMERTQEAKSEDLGLNPVQPLT